jgi:hypothetical protein
MLAISYNSNKANLLPFIDKSAMAIPEGVTAELDVIFIDPTGNRARGRIYIGKPYLETNNTWRCPVGMDGMYTSLPDMAGVNSFHAMCLALKTIQSLSKHFLDEGGAIYQINFESGKAEEEPFAYDSYFRVFESRL